MASSPNTRFECEKCRAVIYLHEDDRAWHGKCPMKGVAASAPKYVKSEIQHSPEERQAAFTQPTHTDPIPYHHRQRMSL